jgi:hypothetical protein
VSTVITTQEVVDGWIEPIPMDRFTFIGLKPEQNPIELDLDLRDAKGSGTAQLLSLDVGNSGAKYLEFDDVATLERFRNTIVSMDLSFAMSKTTDLEEFFMWVVLALLKREVKILFERGDKFSDDNIRITLSISGFTTSLDCKVSDLAGFISQVPETDEEYEERLAAV